MLSIAVEQYLAHPNDSELVQHQMSQADDVSRAFIQSICSTTSGNSKLAQVMDESGIPNSRASSASGRESRRARSGGTLLARMKPPQFRTRQSVGDNLVEVQVDTWHFDALDNMSKAKLFSACFSIFNAFQLLHEYKVTKEVFNHFLDALFVAYSANNNHYHNFNHAVDVCQMTYRMVSVNGLEKVYPKLEIFAVLVAALGHDVGHLGLSNAYLVSTHHELALRYNDASPLENMHCSLLYAILMEGDGQRNVFAELTKDQWLDVRRIIIKCILSTDMSHHFAMITKATVGLLPCSALDTILDFHLPPNLTASTPSSTLSLLHITRSSTISTKRTYACTPCAKGTARTRWRTRKTDSSFSNCFCIPQTCPTS